MRMKLRTAELRKFIGEPLRQTTRRPIDALPGERPLVTISQKMKYPVSTTNCASKKIAIRRPAALPDELFGFPRFAVRAAWWNAALNHRSNQAPIGNAENSAIIRNTISNTMTAKSIAYANIRGA